ncbi:MAG: hypothetical protein HZA90_12200 [Verrucomicrobia bacterium]|nr:hypothetical protein [Verrucomicrobiota bacterium]
MTTTASALRNWLRFGSANEPTPLSLRAGPLTMLFEPDTVFLRRICLGEVEVIRGLYAAVRDRNWGTVPAQISNLKSQISNQSFALAFEVECQQGEIHFRWYGEITGAADGTVKFTFDGEALTSFQRNRIGFCVLHPIRECAGAAARQTRMDGSVVECRFPKTIEPQIFGQASFRELRSLAHEVRPGLWAELQFKGEVFETEDQRNWTDASFKTYCTPLALPFPVEVKAGTRIQQSVTLRLADEASSSRREEAQMSVETAPPHVSYSLKKTPAMAAVETLELVIPSEPSCDLPEFGVSLASHAQPLNAQEASRLAMLQLAHLRADLRLDRSEEWRTTLSRAESEANAVGAALELAVHLPAQGGEVALGELRERLRATSASIKRLLVFRQGEPATCAATLRLARTELDPLGAPIGGGTDAHFCELNREQALGRFGLAEADFVSWPMTPQVHAFDHLSVMETLEAQPHALATIRVFAGERPLVVSPITLKPRFNAVATGADSSQSADVLPPQVDPRQMSLFAAAWTLGSVAALTSAGARSLTYFETTGRRGVMEKSTGSPWPQKFPSAPGAVFPVFFVLAGLAGFRRAAPVVTTTPGLVAALVLFEGTRRRVLLANLTGTHQAAILRCQVPVFGQHVLDETNVQQAVREPKTFLARADGTPQSAPGQVHLDLKPHAFVTLDLT